MLIKLAVVSNNFVSRVQIEEFRYLQIQKFRDILRDLEKI